MSAFACPVCGAPLEKEEKAYRCPKGHSYDIAKEGYVHLLRPDEMHSKSPGDDGEMVAARRRFLEAGWYECFSDGLDSLVLQNTRGEKPVILDAGCGEGYYTGRMAGAFRQAGRAAELFGFDISKTAVRLAAKRYREIPFAVGSMFHIPVPDSSVDCVTDVFAPIVPEELCRVLRPGAALILAVPGPRHLYGLKEILYDAPYENETRDTVYPGFEFLRRVPVRGKIETRDQQTMQDLFAMTPYYWKTPREGGERLKKTDVLNTETGFDFLIYQKVEKT